jgi:putative transposase
MKDKERVTHARTVVYNTNYHIVWTVKYRRKVLVKGIDDRLKEVLHAIAQEKGFLIQNLEVMPDHVQVFASGHPKLSASYMYKMLKGISARRLLLEFPELQQRLWKGRLWTPSTYVETVGHVSEETVTRYINDQKRR